MPKHWDCSFPPEKLRISLEAQLDKQGKATKHNEVVVDATHMSAHLPHSLLGIFYMDNSTKARAAKVHQSFLEAYKLSPIAFPLLHLSLADGFTVAP